MKNTTSFGKQIKELWKGLAKHDCKKVHWLQIHREREITKKNT